MATISAADQARLQERGKLGFGEALGAVMNDGARARRAGWIDRARWIAYERGIPAVHSSSFQHPGNIAHAESRGGVVAVMACLTMKKPCGAIMLGWTPTQTDLAASDWYLLEKGEA